MMANFFGKDWDGRRIVVKDDDILPVTFHAGKAFLSIFVRVVLIT